MVESMKSGVIARPGGDSAWPGRRQGRECPPIRQHLADAPITRKENYVLAAVQYGSVRLQYGDREAGCVVVGVNTAVKHRADTRSFQEKALRLGNYGRVANECVARAQNLGVGRERESDEFARSRHIWLGPDCRVGQDSLLYV